MAFSMFARNPACGRILSQQLLKLAAQPSIAPRTLTTVARNSLIKDSKAVTPLWNAVKSFRTSATHMSSKSGDHSKLWVIERITSALLVPLIPLGLLMPNKLIDATLAILIVAHSHWGLEAIAVDYVRASIFGPFLPKLAIGLVYLFSIATLGGLLYFINHDDGIGYTIRRIWSIKPQNSE